MRVLHAFSKSVLDPRHRFLGTTKDIRGRTQYFAARGIEREELVLEDRTEAACIRALRGVALPSFDAVFIEGTYFPAAIAWIKARHPGLPVLARAINAELPHWLHSASAALRRRTWRRALFDLKSSAVFGLKDARCAFSADRILSITAWEAHRYWKRIAGPVRVATVPYFLPDEYLGAIPAPREKELRCVCMMTTQADRSFLEDAATNLCGLVNGLEGSEAAWKFSITGDFHREMLPPCPRLEVLGVLENPYDALSSARAVALLSDYGFGFKTKLLEAVCCGCYLLVRKKLFERLPPPVQRYSIVVDVRSVQSFREALARCLAPMPEGDPNAELRSEAYAALDQVFALVPPAHKM